MTILNAALVWTVLTLFMRIVLLLLQDCLSPLSMQALPAPPESLCVLDMSTQTDKKEEAEGGLYLNIGLQVCRTARMRKLQDSQQWQKLCEIIDNEIVLVCLSVRVYIITNGK